MSRELNHYDVQTICTLVEECGESWNDAAAWQLHVARSAERLVGGFTGLFMLSSHAAAKPRVLEHATDGNPNVSFSDFVCGEAEMGVPGAARGFATMHARGSLSARFSELAETNYHSSEFYQRFMRPQGAHDTLCALAMSRDNTHINLTLSRSANDRPFSAHDAQLLEALALAVASRCGTRLVTRHQRGQHGLAPREKQTLGALLDGDGEKQVAWRMGISPATAHQYISTIYRHYQVRSRSELLAYFLKRTVK